jgi:hypothetical protein
MYLQSRSKSLDESGWDDWGPRTLWDRMHAASSLMMLAGCLSFVGFLMIAVGTLDLWVVGTSFGAGPLLVSPLIPWGIVVLGLGVMCGFFGAAVKGPSREWNEVAAPPGEAVETSQAPGFRYACPGCGGDVYANQAVCPACGHSLPAARRSGG